MSGAKTQHVAKPPAVPHAGQKARPLDCVVVTSGAEAAPYIADWQELAGNALEQNAFYEPWHVLESLAWIPPDSPLQLVLIYQRPEKGNEKPLLMGVFPLVEERITPARLRVLKLWRHQYCFLGTPLVRPSFAVPVLSRLMEWAHERRPKIAAIEFSHVHGDGRFQQALVQLQRETGLASYSTQQYNRALLQRAADAETYCAGAQTCHNRQELRRKRRRLQEAGDVELRVMQPTDSAAVWAEQFIALEAAGWKGQEKSSLGHDETGGALFARLCEAASARQQLMMLAILLNGRPIAMKCNFLSANREGAFAFKIAFDETWSRVSPGVLLELFNIEQVHSHDTLQWMDSCAKPDHFMIDRLWSERRTIQDLYLSTGHLSGELLCGLQPAWKMARRLGRRYLQRPTSPAPSTTPAAKPVAQDAAKQMPAAAAAPTPTTTPTNVVATGSSPKLPLREAHVPASAP